MRILIVKLSAIGDVAHSLPVLSALKKMYPDAEIDWLVEEAASGLILGHPDLHRIFISRRKSWLKRLRRGDMRPLHEWRTLIREVRAKPYDLVIDLQNLAKSSFWVALARSARKLGFWGTAEYAYVPLTEKVGPEDFNLHAVDRYLTFIKYLGGDSSRAEFSIPATESHMRRAAALLGRGAQIKGEPWVAIHPVALWDTKMWKQDSFREVARRLGAEFHMNVAFTGGAADRDYVEEIITGLEPKPLNACGKTDLLETAALFKQCALAITTDTGPMHVAAAMGTPVVALFGPTDPARTGPYGSGNVVVRSGARCAPCFKKSCATRECMENITPEMALKAVRTRLAALK